MSTETNTTGTDPQTLADLETVLRHSIEGTPVPPELAQRVRKRSERLTEETRQRYGDIDVVQFLRDVRDER